MEPITYLSGLSTVILGYLWCVVRTVEAFDDDTEHPRRFLYQGREVSYTSVLARSISARREALYRSRGLDIERWHELMSERKALRAEIGSIARDYEGDADGGTSLDEAKHPEDTEKAGEEDSGGQMEAADADEPVAGDAAIPSEEKDDIGASLEELDRTPIKEEAEELKGKKAARKTDAAGL
jgi:hypothetical protein